MAVTITNVQFDAFLTEDGRRKSWGIFDITFDALYPTGGEPVDLSRWFRTIESVSYPFKDQAEAGGYIFGTDPDDFATGSFTIEVFWGDYSNDAASGPAVELPNGENSIGDLVVRIEVWGYSW